METTRFDRTQIHLLRKFVLESSKKVSLNELKEVFKLDYSKRMDDCLDDLWDFGLLNQERLDDIHRMDFHQLN